MKFQIAQLAVLALAAGSEALPQFGGFFGGGGNGGHGGNGTHQHSSGVASLPSGTGTGNPHGHPGGAAPTGSFGASPTGFMPARRQFGGFGGHSGGRGGAAPSGSFQHSASGYPVGTGFSSVVAPTGTGVVSVPSSSAVASSAAAVVTAAAAVNNKAAAAAATTALPKSSGTSALSAVQTIAAGKSFDGGMVQFDRGVSCTGQAEGGDSDAVFQIEEGGSLSNVIIGPNQIEGIHCQGACTLTNVWWSAVCEDAFTIKNQDAGDTTTVIGGGAFGADDKVFQHNGAGTLSLSGFYVETFGKLYRSCGNCDTMYERHVIMDNIIAVDGSSLAGINYNYGDSATITNTETTDVSDICVTYTGNDDGDEPTEYSEGADGTYCIYGDDVTSS